MKPKYLLVFLSYVFTLVLGIFLRTFLESKGFGLQKVDQKIINQNNVAVSGIDQFVTYVDFADGRFSGSLVKIHKGDYLALTNASEDLMWLSATMSAWSTGRGFGQGERIMKTFDDIGTYKIKETESGSELMIEVY